jgi:hypothetical protein
VTRRCRLRSGDVLSHSFARVSYSHHYALPVCASEMQTVITVKLGSTRVDGRQSCLCPAVAGQLQPVTQPEFKALKLPLAVKRIAGDVPTRRTVICARIRNNP